MFLTTPPAPPPLTPQPYPHFHLHLLPQAKGITKSGLKSLLMHKVSDDSSTMNAMNAKNINAEDRSPGRAGPP